MVVIYHFQNKNVCCDIEMILVQKKCIILFYKFDCFLNILFAMSWQKIKCKLATWARFIIKKLTMT